jgi:hypothetical protein
MHASEDFEMKYQIGLRALRKFAHDGENGGGLKVNVRRRVSRILMYGKKP